MTDRPIIFSAPMIQALLAGRKTMTRRMAWKPGCEKHARPWPAGWGTPWQRVEAGDRLWVRESMTMFQTYGGLHATCHYPADETGVPHRGTVPGVPDGRAIWLWKNAALPSIHMPRAYSRLTLAVTATKIEPLHDISEDDAFAEGVEADAWDMAPVARRYGIEGDAWFVGWSMGINAPSVSVDAREVCRRSFESLWRTLHDDKSWEVNPEVVALTFTVHKTNIDALPKQAAA